MGAASTAWTWTELRFRLRPWRNEEERVSKASMETIGRYFNERLKTIFPAVADAPGVLRNSANCPLYLLCFAAGNAAGAPIALRIANHLLKKVQ